MPDKFVAIANGAVKRMKDMGDTTHAEVVSLGGGGTLDVSVTSLQAGERNVGSTANGYAVVRQESNGTIVTGVTSAVAVSAGQPAHLNRCMVLNAALAGTCTISGVTDQLGNPTAIVVPAGTAAFAALDFGMIRCENNLQVTLSNAADKVLIGWRPI